MEKITTRGREIEIPGCIDELRPEQYEYFCFLTFALADGVVDADRFRTRWLSYLIGMQKADYTMLREEFISELDEQRGAIDGFFDKEGHPRFDTVQNLLPEYHGYRGPGPMLQGLTFGEFSACWSLVESVDGSDADAAEQAYREMARILYRIPDTEPVPDLLLFHAPRLFGNVWHAIQSAPLEINGRKIDLRIIFKGSGGGKADDKTGWTGIIFEVAGAGVFGTVADVERQDFMTVLLYLYKCKFEYLQEKRKL